MVAILVPVRTTGRALGYLASGVPAGVVGLVWTLAATLVVGLLAVTHLGGPAFLGAAWVTRRLATLERRRAGWVLDRPITSPYVPVTADTVGRRVAAVAGQPATWRDVAWLVVLFPIGLAGGVAGTVIAAVDLGAVTAPAWAWAVPNPHAPFPMKPLLTTTPGRFGLTLIGLALLPLAVWLLRTWPAPRPPPPARCWRPACTRSWSRRPPGSRRPGPGWSTPRPRNCAGSSATCTTVPRPGSWPRA